jgi:hypothetical protein
MQVTSNLRNEKSILAKLMSTENLHVQHAKVITAGFDPTRRILYLPIWKDMSAAIYDLFVSHEISHALHTPVDGWHNSLSTRGPKFKSYLNIIEDVRIERKIKLKYPGVRSQMYKGYQELVHDRDFFGLHKFNIVLNDLNFIDRINIYFKSGATENIKFNEEELLIVSRLENIETWEEVLEISNKIFEQDKENPPKTDIYERLEYSTDEEENSTGDLDNLFPVDEELSEDQASALNGEIKCDDPTHDVDENDSLTSAESESDSNRTINNGAGEFNDDTVKDPYSLTDQEYRSKEENLIDESSKNITYLNVPHARLEKSLIGYKDVLLHNDILWHRMSNLSSECLHNKQHSNLESFANLGAAYYAVVQSFVSFIRKDNHSVVMYLCKEFEMKKRAVEYKREKISKTGIINMNKLHQYKLTDNIFKRISTVAEGKNHGLIMYVDYSGSMAAHIIDTVIQTIILIDFCRRVNIPYKVCTFTDYSLRQSMRRNLNLGSSSRGDQDDYNSDKIYDYKDGDMRMSHDNLYMCEWFSSEMSNSEHQQQLINIFANILSNHQWVMYYLNHSEDHQQATMWKSICNNAQVSLHNIPFLVNRFDNMFGYLYGTPLNDCILHGAQYALAFRKKHNVQFLHSVFLTDGESNGNLQLVDGKCRGHSSDVKGRNIYLLRDPITKKEYKITGLNGFKLTESVLNYYRSITGGSAIGYFICNHVPYNMFRFKTKKDGERIMWQAKEDFQRGLRNQFNKQGYIITKDTAYDSLFCIKGKKLKITQNILNVESDATQRKFVTAFKKMRSSKLNMRPMLTKFVELVA